MPVAGGPKLTTTGILLEVDAADKTSYSGTGTTWTNQVRPGTYNGTLNNISFNSTDAKGALVFTGSNTYVDFGNLGPSLTSSFSFQVAFKPAATASGQPYTILSYASASATSSITFKLDYTSSNQTVVLTTFAGTGSQNIVYSLSASAASGSWNIVHGTFGSTLAALYVNGLGQAYAPTTGSVVGYNTFNRLYAGLNYGSTSGYFTGSVGNIMVNNADLDGVNINKNYNAIASRFNLPVRRSSITDANAFAFVEAAGISDTTQQSAINTLVLGLKSNNLWTKMEAIYPFVGGSAYSHKFNLKNLNAYELTFYGGVTHNNNGVKSNGTNGYAGTSIATTTATTGDIHLSFYTNEVSASIGPFDRDMAINSPLQLELIARRNNDNSVVLVDPAGINIQRPTEIRSGYRVVSRTATNNTRYFKDGVFISNSTTNTSLAVGSPLVIMTGANTGNISVRAQQFASYGLGLTDTDVSNLYILVQAYQTTLGRQV